jgi:DNA-binding CsgD family transcriptional regulator
MGNTDVRLEDARQLFRLLSEARDALDAESAQFHVLEGIRKILHARVATSGLVSGLDRGAFELSASQCAGLSGAESSRLFSSYASRGSKGDPLLERVLALPRTSGIRVHRRCDLLTDKEWLADEIVATVRAPMHLDDTIHAYLPCGRGSVIGLQIVRDAADGAFDERDRNLVELMVLEAGRCLAPRPSLQPRPLTLRERQTLGCLLDGDSEKQAAANLGLSVHTLHDYVKRLYRAFNVASRGELMARVLGAKMTVALDAPRPALLAGIKVCRCGAAHVIPAGQLRVPRSSTSEST